MVILLILAIQLFYLFRETQFNKSCGFIIFSSLAWNIGWLIILQLELSATGTSTYGSDETAYFNTMLQAYDSENWYEIVKNDFNFTYVLYGTLIFKTNIFDPSVFFVRLGNVLLLINMLMFVYLILTKTFLIKSKTVYYGLLFIGFNGIITWTAIRNLKDVMFVYFLVLFIYILLELFLHKRWSIIRIIGLALSWFVLEDIRQWFPYMAIASIALIIFVTLVKNKRFFFASVLMGGIVVASVPLFQKGLSTLLVYTVNYSEAYDGGNITNLNNISFLSLPFSMGRFILGPGPIRGMFGSDSFLTYTTTGNLLITLGGLVWWAVLPLFLMALMSFRNIKKMYLVLFILLFYWATYSYAYAGSGDTRLRGVLYVLCAIYTIPYLVNQFKKRMIPLYVLSFIAIVLVGSYFSYISLA
ncbi:hypothetical protein GC096_03880 [Paenibacillus sp. LMG 31461]|uniref:Glycosyltransferase RgtA/B/C/D-like domain-containing protein n=1 Tax=Paenibacillus plantarum TaxID=2654975 RepID=A0ABX1X596_9BACL|nr:hypothetical protein [Paenibacillus plantarum]NOU63185.1 hypothetical protein [Paenibacillus plantarum]